MIRAAALLAALGGLGAVAVMPAAACDTVDFEGVPFTACTIDMARDDLRLFLRDETGTILGSFARVEAALPPGKRLGVAMNAGMYHPDRRPVGLYVENGAEEMRVVTSQGPGNFGLLPNGVLCLHDDRAQIVESRAFAANPPECRFATQSGPMLVIDGALHPRFLAGSSSLNIRNGVGVDASGRIVHLVISDAAVNFHQFARFFRDHLGVPQALYLDGRVSRLHAPGLGRSDFGLPLGPIIGTVVDAPAGTPPNPPVDAPVDGAGPGG